MFKLSILGGPRFMLKCEDDTRPTCVCASEPCGPGIPELHFYKDFCENDKIKNVHSIKSAAFTNEKI